jgi:hypothetical protein
LVSYFDLYTYKKEVKQMRVYICLCTGILVFSKCDDDIWGLCSTISCYGVASSSGIVTKDFMLMLENNRYKQQGNKQMNKITYCTQSFGWRKTRWKWGNESSLTTERSDDECTLDVLKAMALFGWLQNFMNWSELGMNAKGCQREIDHSLNPNIRS